jgi:hypothetical protein
MACLAGCGSGTLGPDNGPSGSVLTPAVVSASYQSAGGGYGPVPPSGAACDPGKWTYLITTATHDVSWKGCSVNGPESDPTSYVAATVDHPLDASTWAAVHSALANVTISSAPGCGADKDQQSLTVQTNSDAITYGDDFYACQKQYDAYVATARLDALYAELSQLP